MTATSGFLVADIGGTNARFALAGRDAAGRPELRAIRELRTAAYPTLAAAARDYLTQSGATVRRGIFAVASPITGDGIKITNNPWAFSIRALQAELALDALQLINDFAAVAHAVPHLHREDVVAIGGVVETGALASERHDGHYVMLGPGTGLGVGGLMLRDGEPLVLETEGGHVGFAPTTPYELRLLEALWREYPRVSAERLLSGQGLLNLYRTACTLEGETPALTTPEQISAQAAAEPGGLGARCVALFCELLGGFAGDAVLMQGAWNGVYLAGGITQKLLTPAQHEGFRLRFKAKGRFEPLLERVPVFAITHPQAGLLGAAARGLLT